MGAGEVSPFLSDLATKGRVAASTQNQALNARVFLYQWVLETEIGEPGNLVRARRPKRVLVVLTCS